MPKLAHHLSTLMVTVERVVRIYKETAVISAIPFWYCLNELIIIILYYVGVGFCNLPLDRGREFGAIMCEYNNFLGQLSKICKVYT